jgi:hypothetical protein
MASHATGVSYVWSQTALHYVSKQAAETESVYAHKSDETGDQSASTSYDDDSTRKSCTGAPREVHGLELLFWVA